ncbi:MAG: glycosyltransferase family 39 protein [Coleofasciculaceae cyanobacterium SM2_1_6]|nr:glycosyltransferase family 39 protein [Coleofasciculaceae cyanobacterium SM2_1_6]
MVALPFTAVTVLIFLLYSKYHSWRDAVLAASVMWGVFIVLTTEILSLFSGINFTSLSIIWFILNAILLFICFKYKVFSNVSPNQIFGKYRKLNVLNQLFIISVIIIILAIGLVAAITPPNNWDTMAYVMPRIMHWIQNHSVNHYPTHYTPQLYNGPGAEFILMHLQVLSGGDHFNNLIQWLSLIACLIGSSLIAKQLGANLRGQIFTIILCATIPVGILHGSNSKNTWVVSLWLICLIYYSMLMIKTRPSWRLVLGASSSLGLAVLTKGTSYIYALPFLLWLFFVSAQQLRLKVFPYLIGGFITTLVINSGHYIRNYLVFGSPLSTYPYKWSNDIYSVPIFISNVIRNISLHLIPPFLYNEVREFSDRLIIGIHKFLQVDPLDTKTTLMESGGGQFSTQLQPLFEDTAGNHFHFWFSILAIVFIIANNKCNKNSYLAVYLLTTVSSFLLFCLIIKWQIWHSRLHLPFFILFCPIIGIVFSTLLKPRVSQYLILLILIMTIPYLGLNDLRPFMGSRSIFTNDRISLYFAARIPLKEDYLGVASLLHQQKCENIGIIQRPDSWEYPLWVAINKEAKR